MCVGHPAEKLDQIDVVTGLRCPTGGIDRAANQRSQKRLTYAIHCEQIIGEHPPSVPKMRAAAGDGGMTDSLWKVTVSSLFPNDSRAESVYEWRHADEDAAREAALLQVAIDHGGSALDTIIDVEKIG